MDVISAEPAAIGMACPVDNRRPPSSATIMPKAAADPITGTPYEMTPTEKSVEVEKGNKRIPIHNNSVTTPSGYPQRGGL
jgi:hypothetical protein